MIENDAFKLLLINLFHLNPDDIANILCTTFNKMMVLVVTLTDKHQSCPYCGFKPTVRTRLMFICKSYNKNHHLIERSTENIGNIIRIQVKKID